MTGQKHGGGGLPGAAGEKVAHRNNTLAFKADLIAQAARKPATMQEQVQTLKRSHKLSRRHRELHVVQFAVHAAHIEQFLVCAALNDASLFHYENQI